MNNEAPQRTPLDPQAALEELERFKQDIERYRAQRQAVGERFDKFIQSFETAPERPAIGLTDPQREVPSAVLHAAAPPSAPPIAPPAPAVDEPVTLDALDRFPDESLVSAAPPVAADVSSPPDSPFAPASDVGAEQRAGALDPIGQAIDSHGAVSSESRRTPVPRSRSAISTPVLIGGALIVLLAGWMLVGTPSNQAPEAAPTVASAPNTPSPVPEPAPAAAPAPVPAAPPTSGSALTTVRRVWMRVTVDGARVLEREVPAGTTVPLNAEKTIVIRTGDAGAVKLSIRGGEAAALGAEGEVVTRFFTVPPRAPAGR